MPCGHGYFTDDVEKYVDEASDGLYGCQAFFSFCNFLSNSIESDDNN